MLITPIDKINSMAELEKLGHTSTVTDTANAAELPFQSMFEDAINNVKETNANVNEEIYKLSTGQSDNLHDITIASAKASLSVDLLVQLRNKALDAYKEIMSIGV